MVNYSLFAHSVMRVSEAEAAMTSIKLGANFTVFLLFFGVALLEAFQSQNWLKAILWLAIGTVSLIGDNLRRNQLPNR